MSHTDVDQNDPKARTDHQHTDPRPAASNPAPASTPPDPGNQLKRPTERALLAAIVGRKLQAAERHEARADQYRREAAALQREQRRRTLEAS